MHIVLYLVLILTEDRYFSVDIHLLMHSGLQHTTKLDRSNSIHILHRYSYSQLHAFDAEEYISCSC